MRILAVPLFVGAATLVFTQGTATAQDVIVEDPSADMVDAGGGDAPLAGTTIELTDGPDRLCLLNVNGVRSYCKGDRVVHTIGGAVPVVVHAKRSMDIVVVRDTAVGGCSCTCQTTYPMTDYAYGGSSVTVGTGREEDQAYGGSGTNFLYGHQEPTDPNPDVDDAMYDVLVGGRQQDTIWGAGGNDTIVDRAGGAEVLMGESDDDCMWDQGVNGWTKFDCGIGAHDKTPNSGTNCEDWIASCLYACPMGTFP